MADITWRLASCCRDFRSFTNSYFTCSYTGLFVGLPELILPVCVRVRVVCIIIVNAAELERWSNVFYLRNIGLRVKISNRRPYELLLDFLNSFVIFQPFHLVFKFFCDRNRAVKMIWTPILAWSFHICNTVTSKSCTWILEMKSSSWIHLCRITRY